ncbi:MAG: hypothetical protein Aureis2KO_23920 [Aureisphaera sp.]
MKKSFFYLLLLIGGVCFSQDEGGEFNYTNEVNRMLTIPTSSEAAAFGTYGETAVSLFEGKPNVAIPLYTFKGLEMDLPISLTYDIDARKVEDIAPGTGLGWNLALGGSITRITNGLPDSYTNVTVGLGGYSTLLDSAILRNKLGTYNDKEINGADTFADVAEALDYVDFLDKVQTGSYDVALDSYVVSAPGLTAKIIMVFDNTNNTVSPKVMDNPRIKINSYATSANHTWIITGEDGTRYTFLASGGGELTTSESFNDTFSIGQNSSAPYIMSYYSAWKLTEMISPNGKDTYKFIYDDLDTWTQEVFTWHNKRIDNDPPPTDPNNWIYFDEIESGNKYKIIQQALLQVKHNEDVIVDITLGQRDDFVLDNKIESLEVKSPFNGTTINFFKFTYDHFGTGSNEEELRLRLDKIEIAGNGYTGTTHDFEKEYNFTYDNPEDMPARDSFSQDRWGYSNGAPNNNGGTLFEEWVVGGHTLIGADRNFSFSDALVGILTRIDYPTGGYTEFDYEQHKKTVGGVDTYYDGIRIAGITNYTDSGTFSTKKTYEYEELYEEGYLRPLLKYNTTEQREFGGPTHTRYHRLAKANNGDVPYISYGRVTERDINSSGSALLGKTVHEFPTGLSNGAIVDVNQPPFATSHYGQVGAGQLEKQTVIDHGNNTLVEIQTTYTSDVESYSGFAVKDNPNNAFNFIMFSETGNGDEVVGSYVIASTGIGGVITTPAVCSDPGNTCTNVLSYSRIQPFHTNFNPEYLKTSTQVSKQLFGTDEVTTTMTSEYDDVGIDYLLRKSTTTTSRSGESKITKYYYPNDFASTDTDMQALVTANRLSTPVKTEYYHKETTEELKYTQETKYDEFGASPAYLMPDKIMAYRLNDTPESRMDFRAYDPHGNLCEVAKTNGQSTSYVWGYDGRLIVAKVENATYAEIEALSFFGNGFTLSGALSQQQEDQLRALGNSLVTTYTYTDFMQVGTITDPREYKTHFHYDGENRLLYVTDGSSKVLNSNEYNYRINN